MVLYNMRAGVRKGRECPTLIFYDSKKNYLGKTTYPGILVRKGLVTDYLVVTFGPEMHNFGYF